MAEDFMTLRTTWRTEVARVHPPLDESELSKYFIRALEGIYFDKMMSMMGQKFTKLVKMGDFVEEGVKFGKIHCQLPTRRTIPPIPQQSPNFAHTSYVPYRAYTTQPHDIPPRAPAHQNPQRPYVPVQAPIHQNRPAYAPRPRPILEARNARTYTPIAEPYAQLFERLRIVGVLQPVEGKLQDPIPRNFDGNN
ncbi:hypothetical protein KY284_032760 [Solanum tuberosum]|nr:hypothetical protein KY284_032760 [Solanum tuberosum]